MYRLYQFYRSKMLLLLILGAFHNSFGQENTTSIKGQLTDEQTGESIIGAFVYIKGTKTGGQTDVDGNFEIKTTQEPPFILAVNYVGYETKEIEVYETDDAVQFKLKALSAANEVVVVGYGEQKRSDITGAVSSVPTELKSQPVTSVERLLQGAVPGAIVTQTSGQPGGGVSVQIRGANSISATSDPLYVIDGFPINNDYSVGDAGVTSGAKINPLSTLNTIDIESIDVLKDASATAIYGSRGANGVILVTTKKAKRNETTVTYDGFKGVQEVLKTIDVIGAGELWQLRKDAAANTDKQNGTTSATTALNTFYKNQLNNAKNGNYTLDTSGAGTNYQDAAFRSAPIESHSVTLLTGSDKTRLAFAGNYFDQQGVLINTGFKRFTGRVNIDHDINDRAKITSSIVASNISSKVSPDGAVLGILAASPVQPIYKNDGTYLVTSGLTTSLTYPNPINSLNNQINNTSTNRLLGNVAAEYKIIPGLTAKVLFGVDFVNNKQNRYLPKTTYEGVNLQGSAIVGTTKTDSWLNENTLNYTRVFNKVHSINAVAGFTAQQSVTEVAVVNGQNFASDIFAYNSLGDASTLASASSRYDKWSLASWLGRANYVFNEKYLATVTIRADGSSRFGADKKWGYFPSVALGWNVHRESFLASVKQISNLKIRGSIGITGNQSIPTYNSLAQYRFYRYLFGGTPVAGYAPLNNANPELSWEKTRQIDIGIDLGLFNNRINIVLDYYDKRTTDLLLAAPVSGTSGLSIANVPGQPSYIFQNIGALSNRGWEFGLNTQNIVGKKFKWSTIFVFSANKNRIEDLGGVQQIIPNASLPSIQKVGNSIGSFIVYETDGLIQPGEEGPKALTPQAFKSAGAQKYKDLNGDGVITQSGDRKVINNDPGISLGLTNTLGYDFGKFGSVDLSFFFQGVFGAKIYNQNRALLEIQNGLQNAAANSRDRYTPTNTDTDVKAAYQESAVTISDRFIEDASYIRLKNATLGYSFPKELLSKIKIKDIRLYVSIQNYWTSTRYTGFDPEVSANGQDVTLRGVDNGAYPNSKTILGGLSFTF